MYTSPALCLGLIPVKGMEMSVVVVTVVKGSVVSFAFLGETVSCNYKKLLCYIYIKFPLTFFLSRWAFGRPRLRPLGRREYACAFLHTPSFLYRNLIFLAVIVRVLGGHRINPDSDGARLIILSSSCVVSISAFWSLSLSDRL